MANSQEYGLFQMIDLGLLNPNQPANIVDRDLLVSAIQYDQAQHNADINAILALFSTDTTDYSEEVRQSGSSRNQPVDENGRALPIKPGVPYTVSYPIQGSGNAWGTNHITRLQMTVKMLSDTMSNMFRGDFIWVREHVLGAHFQNVNYTYRDITGRGNLTIRGLANGDATLYYKNGVDALATDTHYKAQAAAISDAANPYPGIVSEIAEHPLNTGEIISFISSSLVATTTALAEFVTAELPAGIDLAADENVLTANLGITLPPFATVKGKTQSGTWIVEWPAMPAGYILTITTGGPRPLARRLFAEEQLRGFRAMGERADFPYFEEQWQRWEGYAVRNRLGAVVTFIDAGGVYAIPAGFGMPMA